MPWKYSQKACVFKLLLLRHWSKTAQVQVFLSKIISTRRTIPICFPTHSMEPVKCFQNLQRGHRWRRKFSKGKKVGKSLEDCLNSGAWLSKFLPQYEENGPGSGFSLQFVFLHVLWNPGNVFKRYSVVISCVENFLRAKNSGSWSNMTYAVRHEFRKSCPRV